MQMPPDPKHFENPFWYDTFGVDLIDQRHLFSKEAGEQVTEVMKLLEEHPKQGQNMLVKAAAESNEEVLKALLAHGVQLVKKNDGKKEWAWEADDEGMDEGGSGGDNGDDEENGHDRDTDYQKNDHEMDEGEDGDDGDEDEDYEDQWEVEKRFPLHAAAFHGQIGCVKILVEAGIDVNLREEDGNTPLMSASSSGNVELVNWLLQHGADPTLKREYGIGALHCAAGSGNVELVRLLLAQDDSKDSGGENAGSKVEDPSLSALDITSCVLAASAESGSEEMVRYLLERGGFPEENSESATWHGERMTVSQRTAVSETFVDAVTMSSLPIVRLRLIYLSPQDGQGKYSQPGLDAKHRQSLTDDLRLAEPMEFSPELLELILDFVYFPSNLPDPDQHLVSERNSLVSDLINNAAASGNIPAMTFVFTLLCHCRCQPPGFFWCQPTL